MIDRATFIRMAAVAGVAAEAAIVRPAIAGGIEKLSFDFRSNFWENLHHRLYFQAQAFDYVGHGNALTPGKYVWDAVAADALSDYQLLNPSQRAVWETTMAAYVTLGYTRKDLLDDSMAAIDAALMNVPVDALPMPSSGLNAHLVETLIAAAPTYRATLWDVDDRENRAWIAMVSPLVARHTDYVTQRLRQAYRTPWPLGPFHVDVSRYANWAGFYTNVDPIHTICSTRDMRNNATLAVVPNRGTTACEIVFHEASHTIVTPGYGAIGAGIENASTALRVAEPEGLWHAVIFYTAGRVVADAVAGSGERYEMVADSVDVYTGPWKNYRAALVEHWQPYLDGHTGSIDDALTSVVATVTS